ncbi:MAG: AAA family ATPase [Muribaculaceae bacterium]|nr:AAA family ATPase [Muribaculaceae bacterium]
MRRLTIRNIGPIDDVELDLKRVNVIMGPQSAGKSCILKIACFCAWAEKRIQLEQGKNGFSDYEFLKENLLVFHKMDGFIREGSMFSYKTGHVSFKVDFDKKDDGMFSMAFNKKGHWEYRRSRVAYIPAERNIVAVIPNWFEVSLGNTNLKNFVSDWNMARNLSDTSQELSILNLGVQYYYDADRKQDMVRMANGKPLRFADASSGVQSVVPMWVYMDYLFHKQYQELGSNKLSIDADNENILQHIYGKKYKPGLAKRIGNRQAYIGKIGMGKLAFANEDEYKECKSLFNSFTQTAYSDIYLEEPEQNLFPVTQVTLIETLMAEMKKHNDSIFIATHSPFILYALNNCMLGYLVKDKIESGSPLLAKRDCWVNPKEVAVWEIRDGVLSSEIDKKSLTIQDKSGLIRGNYFDRVMKQVMADFTNYIAYYD